MTLTAAEIQVLLTARDQSLSSGLDKAQQQADAFGKKVAIASGIATAALLGIGVAGVSMAKNFEHEMSQVGAVAQASATEMAALRDEALAIGADTAFSARDAAAAMQELAAGGRDVTEILEGEARAAVDLAAAGNYGLAESGRTIAVVMDIWKDEIKDAADVVNRLTGAANTSRFGVEDMSQAIAQGGAAARLYGQSFEDFAAGIAAVASNFNSGSDAGTSWKTMITTLAAPTGAAAKEIAALGLNFRDANGKLLENAGIIDELHRGLDGLTQAERDHAMAVIFGSDAIRAAAGLYALTSEEYRKLQQVQGDTSAADIAAQRMNNLSGDMEALKGSFETAAISLASQVIPVLRDLTDAGTVAVNAFGGLPESTQNLILMSTVGVAAVPAAIATIGQMAKAVQGLSAFAGTASGKLTLFAAGITGITIAADLLLQKTTGHGLVERIFGDVAEIEALEKAARAMNTVMIDATEPTERLAIAQAQLAETLRDYANAGGEALNQQSTFNKILLGSDQRIFGFDVGLSKSKDTYKEFTAATIASFQSMKDNGASLQELVDTYREMPFEMREAVKSTFDYSAAMRKLKEDAGLADGALARWMTTLKDMQAPEFLLEGTLADEFIEITPAATAGASAVDRFAASLVDSEGKARDFEDVLKDLNGAFQDLNPAVSTARLENAFLKEELADLKDKGDDLTAADRERIRVIEKELIPANDRLIKSEGDNVEALEASAPILERLMGTEGYGGLRLAMNEVSRTQEGQIDILKDVSKAYLDLRTGEIPAAIQAFGDLKAELTPEEWATMGAAVGPELLDAIRTGVSDPAKRAELVGLMESLGLAMVAGIGTGIGAGVAGAMASMAAAVAQIVAAGQAAAETGSPSRRTRDDIGLPMAQGVAWGIRTGTPEAAGAMRALVGDTINWVPGTLSVVNPVNTFRGSGGTPRHINRPGGFNVDDLQQTWNGATAASMGMTPLQWLQFQAFEASRLDSIESPWGSIPQPYNGGGGSGKQPYHISIVNNGGIMDGQSLNRSMPMIMRKVRSASVGARRS